MTMIHPDSVKAWEAETEHLRNEIKKWQVLTSQGIQTERELRAENERLQAALDTRSRSDGVLMAIVFTLNSAGARDYEENPITEINVLQGVRRLAERANG